MVWIYLKNDFQYQYQYRSVPVQDQYQYKPVTRQHQYQYKTRTAVLPQPYWYWGQLWPDPLIAIFFKLSYFHGWIVQVLFLLLQLINSPFCLWCPYQSVITDFLNLLFFRIKFLWVFFVVVVEIRSVSWQSIHEVNCLLCKYWDQCLVGIKRAN